MGSLDYKIAENSVFRAERAETKEQKKELYQRAVRMYKRAAEFFRSTRRKDKEALCYMKAARAARRYEGGEQEAIDNFAKAAEMFEELGEDTMRYARDERAEFLRDAAKAYSRLHQLDPGQGGLEAKSSELMEAAERLEKQITKTEKKASKFTGRSRFR